MSVHRFALCFSHFPSTAAATNAAASSAETVKWYKYSNHVGDYIFELFDIGTLEVEVPDLLIGIY